MENKNTMLLTVVAIATLLVTVFGATFAYFATTQNINANIPVDISTASQAASFTALAEGNINISVDAYKMQQADANATTEVTTRDDLTDTAALNVVLKAAAEGLTSECRYNIIWIWTTPKYKLTDADATSKYYWRTSGVTKEFTIEGSAVATNTTTGTTTTPYAEINFDELESQIAQKKVDSNGNFVSGNSSEYRTIDYITLVRNAKIIVDKVSGGNVKWTFTVRFYNSTHDQSIQMGRNWSGTISVDPDSVSC